MSFTKGNVYSVGSVTTPPAPLLSLGDELELLLNQGDKSARDYVQTFDPTFDKYIDPKHNWGFERGGYYVLAAETGHGKTCLALSWLKGMLSNPTLTAYIYSGEDSKRRYLEKLLRAYYGDRQAAFDEEGRFSMSAAARLLEIERPDTLSRIYVDAASGCTEYATSKSNGIRELEERIKSLPYTPDIVILDNPTDLSMSEMTVTGNQNENATLGTICATCQRLALECNAVVIVPAHCRKPSFGESGGITLSMIKGASELVQLSHSVFFMQACGKGKDGDTRGKMRLVCLKSRNEQALNATCNIVYNAKTATYTAEAPKEESAYISMGLSRPARKR